MISKTWERKKERKETECLLGVPSLRGKRNNTCSLHLSSKKVGKWSQNNTSLANGC